MKLTFGLQQQEKEVKATVTEKIKMRVSQAIRIKQDTPW